MLRVRNTAGHELASDDGVYAVTDQQTYTVESDMALPDHPFWRKLPVSGTHAYTLSFDNYVGLAELGGLRFRVQSSKLSDGQFHTLLDEVVSESAALGFDFDSRASLPFSRASQAPDDIAYHALAYLRHIMCGAPREERLETQFLQIASNPHRRLEFEPAWVPTSRVSRVGSRGLLAIASHPEQLVPIPAGSRLTTTGLGARLARPSPRFPDAVLAERRVETFDTHENRLVRHLLEWAADLVSRFASRDITNPDLRRDLTTMRHQLDWLRTFGFLDDVSELTVLPLSSTVMQRRAGYREFLSYYLKLGLSSSLADDRARWHRLLDLKDCALLYEMWCFFTARRCLDEQLGPPSSAQLVTADDDRHKLPWTAKVVYRGGDVELLYNPTYRAGAGSYSVSLRPDIVVRRKDGDRWRALVLDAKLKFDGEKLTAEREDVTTSGARTATRNDLYKMHTYRDALREAYGAYVLYPGTELCSFPARHDAPSYEGIGAIPLQPAGDAEALSQLLRELLQGPPAQRA